MSNEIKDTIDTKELWNHYWVEAWRMGMCRVDRSRYAQKKLKEQSLDSQTKVEDSHEYK